jgi:hypothetical protein
MEKQYSFRKSTLLHLPRFDASGSPSVVVVPDIARRSQAPAIVWASVLAGALSTVAVWQVNIPHVFYLGPGVIFGCMVLMLWCRLCRISWGQTLAAVGLAPVAFAAVVYLTLRFDVFTLAAPLVGCAIMFAPIFARCHPRVRYSLFITMGVGWLLGLMLIAPCVALIGGVAVWQIAVAYCMSTALHVDDV